jgi:thiamine transport system substrate-binding protein
MLTPEFQNEVASQMYVYPVLEGAAVPPEFEQYAQVALEPVTVEPGFIEENRDRFIDRWTTVVLR